MGRQGRHPGGQARRLLVALALAAAWGAAAAVQIVYTSDPSPSFSDNDAQGPAYVVGFSQQDQEPPSTPHRSMVVRAANGTSYRCYIPTAASAPGDAASSEGSSTGVSMAAEGSLLPQKTPSQLLEALAEHCYYRIEEWWTYELCFKKKLRQFHKEGGRVVSQYLLGVYNVGEAAQEDDVQVDITDLSGGSKYVAQQYGAGETCELTGKPRQAEVRFTCGAGTDTLLSSVKEVASCNYVITITTPRLCKHPAFQQQSAPTSLIRCHPLPPEAEAAAAGAAGATGAADGQCGGGGEQQAEGTCAAAGDAAALAAAAAAGADAGHSSSTATGAEGDGSGGTAAVASNGTQSGDGGSKEAADAGGDEDGSLLQQLVEGDAGYYDDDEEEEEQDGYYGDDELYGAQLGGDVDDDPYL